MKNKFKFLANKLSVLFHLLVFYHLVLMSELVAQPDWKINPSEFEYNMTVTSIAALTCDYITDERDLLAAFVDGQLRGVGKFDVLDQGRFYCFLTVYDTLYSGHRIQFRIYDASEDSIYNANETMIFADNKIVGSIFNPFVFQIQSPLKDLVLDQLEVHPEMLVGTKIGSLYLRNLNNDTLTASFTFVDDSLGRHNELLDIQGNQLILKQGLRQIKDSILSIHVSAKNKNQCIKDAVINIIVKGIEANAVVNSTIQEIKIFPNPTQDEVFISADLDINRIIVINEFGMLMSVENVLNKKSIDLSGLASGIYFIHLQKNEKSLGVFKVSRI